MEERDLAEDLLEVRLGLLRALAQGLEATVRLLFEEVEEHVEKLVAGHARHAFELALGLGFGALAGDR